MEVKRPYPRTAPCAVSCRGDGNQILALIGSNIMEGVAGFGDTLPDALRSLAEELDAEVGYKNPENLFMLGQLLTELYNIRATGELPTIDNMDRIYRIMDAV